MKRSHVPGAKQINLDLTPLCSGLLCVYVWLFQTPVLLQNPQSLLLQPSWSQTAADYSVTWVRAVNYNNRWRPWCHPRHLRVSLLPFGISFLSASTGFHLSQSMPVIYARGVDWYQWQCNSMLSWVPRAIVPHQVESSCEDSWASRVKSQGLSSGVKSNQVKLQGPSDQVEPSGKGCQAE